VVPDGGRVAGPAVEIRGLEVRRRGVRVLRGVDLEIGAGAWVAVVGPNGAGKTTLLHVLGGLLDPRAATLIGTVQVTGLDPRRAGRRRTARRVALVPQRPVVPAGLRVRDLVLLGRTPHIGVLGGESSRDRAAVTEALDRLHLTHLSGRVATELSGGELQRVVLARALVQQPAVVLLDEPTSALDIGHQQTVLDLVDRLRREEGLTVVAAMHDLTLAGQYAERLIVLDAGEVIADGPPSHVLTPQLMAKVYEARVRVLDSPDGPVVVPVRDEWA
jgi:iron complex transport system ATP-binding protein